MRVVYLEYVEGDLAEGRDFYDRQEPGIGDYFVDSILADAESLALYAGVHREVFGFHRMLGKTFPFAIYYRVEEETVFVYAILDMRSHPSWIRSELEVRG